jgi:hypothetical protein
MKVCVHFPVTISRASDLLPLFDFKVASWFKKIGLMNPNPPKLIMRMRDCHNQSQQKCPTRSKSVNQGTAEHALSTSSKRVAAKSISIKSYASEQNQGHQKHHHQK